MMPHDKKPFHQQSEPIHARTVKISKILPAVQYEADLIQS